MPEISKLLMISTAHIPLADDRILRSKEFCKPVLPVGFIFSLEPSEHGASSGYLMSVGGEIPESDKNGYTEAKAVWAEDNTIGLSDALLHIQLYARAIGCDYVILDPDAPVEPGLPTYKWEPDDED